MGWVNEVSNRALLLHTLCLRLPAQLVEPDDRLRMVTVEGCVNVTLFINYEFFLSLRLVLVIDLFKTFLAFGDEFRNFLWYVLRDA